jgi:hypothetical protein
MRSQTPQIFPAINRQSGLSMSRRIPRTGFIACMFCRKNGWNFMGKFFGSFVFLTVFALAGYFSQNAFSQTKTTILANGPSANRLNITLLSEGYRDVEAAQFLQDATNVVQFFLAAEPYHEYRNYFNASAIFVASVDSGSDHPAYPAFKDTYFNSSYDSEDRFITIPLDKNGKGKVDALLEKFAPENDLTILIVNDLVFGGAGGPMLITSRNVSAPEIVVHESGHTLGGLGDEYSDFYPGYPDVEEPNTTRETNRDLIKWKAWIRPETPVPTPESGDYANVIGLFQGAHYQSNGWYRPKLDCGMRTLGVPFCEVCSEALVKAICSRVSLADSFFPTANKLSVTSMQAMDFHVTLLRPATHDLSLQWFTNEVAVADATNAAFHFETASLAKGTHFVRAEIRDLTPLVRTDPQNILSNSIVWKISKSFAPPGPFESVKGRFSGIFYDTNSASTASSGSFNLTLTATGAFSGKLVSPEFSSSFKGAFDSENHASVTVSRKGKTSLALNMEIDLNTRDIHGSISDSIWTAQLDANANALNSFTAAFTFLIPSSGETNSPFGDGFGSATLRSNGALRLSGKLADGTSIHFGGDVSETGEMPICARLYKGRGMLLGWFNFSETNVESPQCIWVKNAGASGKLFTQGFTNQTIITGDRYDPPSSGQAAVDWTSALISLQDGDLESTLRDVGTVEKNTFHFSGTNGIALSIKSKTGLISGKFIHPLTRKTAKLQGALLQKRNVAGGFFLGTNASGAITLTDGNPD